MRLREKNNGMNSGWIPKTAYLATNPRFPHPLISKDLLWLRLKQLLGPSISPLPLKNIPNPFGGEKEGQGSQFAFNF